MKMHIMVQSTTSMDRSDYDLLVAELQRQTDYKLQTAGPDAPLLMIIGNFEFKDKPELKEVVDAFTAAIVRAKKELFLTHTFAAQVFTTSSFTFG